MSIVTVAELAAVMGTTLTGTAATQAQLALDLAEQQISGALGMLETDGLALSRRASVDKTFYVAFDGAELYVPTGPLVVLNQVLIDGADYTTSIEIRDYWSIRWISGNNSFGKGQKIQLDAEIGWVSGTPAPPPGVTIPAAVKNAVLIQAIGLYTNLTTSVATGQVKSSERIGDYAVSWDTSKSNTSGEVSATVMGILGQIARAPYVGA